MTQSPASCGRPIPTRYRADRRAAWRELRAEIREAGPTELWRYTADMLYLIDNPVVREAFFPTRHAAAGGRARGARDAPVIRAIARRHEGPAAAALLERWRDEAPEMFSVVREGDGGVAGFFTLVDGQTLHPSLVAGDPVLEAWTRDLHDRPLPKGQLALGLRRWLDEERGESPCASQAACWLDVKRTYMALRPALRRMYVVVRDVPGYWPVVERLGFRPFANSVATLDGVEYSSVVLDFGPGSVDGWLAELVAGELGVGDDELDEAALELTVQGARVALTPLEFGLFRHLREREGAASAAANCSTRSGTPTSRAAATSSTPSCARCAGSSAHEAAVVETVRGQRLPPARRLARAPELASSHRNLIEAVRDGRSVASHDQHDAITIYAGLAVVRGPRPLRHRPRPTTGVHGLFNARGTIEPFHIHDHASHLKLKAEEPIDVAIVGAQLVRRRPDRLAHPPRRLDRLGRGPAGRS